MCSCYLEIFRVIHFFVWTLSWTGIWKFDSPHVKTELHSHINFYRQLVQWWRIRKFFLPPNTHGSPAGNWHRPAAGGHWATAAALSSLAARPGQFRVAFVSLQSETAELSSSVCASRKKCEQKYLFQRDKKTAGADRTKSPVVAASNSCCRLSERDQKQNVSSRRSSTSTPARNTTRLSFTSISQAPSLFNSSSGAFYQITLSSSAEFLSQSWRLFIIFSWIF